MCFAPKKQLQFGYNRLRRIHNTTTTGCGAMEGPGNSFKTRKYRKTSLCPKGTPGKPNGFWGENEEGGVFYGEDTNFHFNKPEANDPLRQYW